MQSGIFKGWLPGKSFGFITPDDGSSDVFVHVNASALGAHLRSGARVRFQTARGPKGIFASIVEQTSIPVERDLAHHQLTSPGDSAGLPEGDGGSAVHLYALYDDPSLTSDDLEVEDLDHTPVRMDLLREVAQWKREARAEDNNRYFWHVREVDDIAAGDRYFVIGRKGCGKTAICEHFNGLKEFDVFAEKLSFKNFPFNELYQRGNDKYTAPNQFITIWKYLIYSTVCRLMLRNEAIPGEIRQQLASLYEDSTPLSRRIGKWVGQEFGVSLLGLSVKFGKPKPNPTWIESVDFLEDLLLTSAGTETYFVLFDELDEDYRDLVQNEQLEQYRALITSLFKAVQDVRNTFGRAKKIFPVIFLRDDIYELIQDADKNKWGDFKVDLNWDSEKIKRLIAFRVSRAAKPECPATELMSFQEAWATMFGRQLIGSGKGKKKKIETFEFISRSTLLRPRDFVAYLQNCAHAAVEANTPVSPDVVRAVDKGFSNYLRQELTDELFAILPDISAIFDAISQLRKWNFSIQELVRAYGTQVENGFIKERNVKFVLQVLYLFSIIGNMPRPGRYVFRYQNREARLNFNERIVVHRGLFKALQIL